jgi:hypothetical protein
LASGRGIYVEIFIRSAIDEIWLRTQDPSLHQQWDLRFSEIKYLPRPSESEPQRFLYSTRLGFGLRVDGEGESTGTRADAAGVRTSALKFWSGDTKSLIEEGSGYWRYVPADSGTTFLTWYDYRTRFGEPGRILDRLVFRPLIGWATAWSFDRLRLWIEEGVAPQAALTFAVVHAIARTGIAFVWLWQGLVPKLLFKDADERALLAAAGLPESAAAIIGGVEIVFAAAGVAFWTWRPYFLLTSLAMVFALGAVSLQSPAYLTKAFNPVALNAAVMALCLAGHQAARYTPSASRTLRSQRKEE